MDMRDRAGVRAGSADCPPDIAKRDGKARTASATKGKPPCGSDRSAEDEFPDRDKSAVGEIAWEEDENLSPGQRNRLLGERGEDAAARFLTKRGYHIVERNWKCFAGEADIIAIAGQTLAFIEVKTRRGTRKGFPAEAVGQAKRERYERIALAYLCDNYLVDVAVRFDVVSIVVLPGERAFIRHHVDAW